jgi:hypothetical protein
MTSIEICEVDEVYSARYQGRGKRGVIVKVDQWLAFGSRCVQCSIVRDRKVVKSYVKALQGALKGVLGSKKIECNQ